MSPVRKLVDDLVEKRLWPVALLLVVALIAIPVLIGGGSGDTSSTNLSAAPASAPVADATPAVELIGPPAVRTRAGKVRDPFRRKAAKAPDSAAKPAATSSSPAPSGSTGAATKSGGSSSSSKATGSAPTTSKPKATKPAVRVPIVRVDPAVALAARSVYQTAVHLKDANHDYTHALDRLAVLGDPASPALQYIGVSPGGEYAIFLLGPAATASGEAGACVVADPCRAIGLRKGDKLEVEVARPNAAPLHYAVKVTSLRRVTKSTATRAQRVRDHVARRGKTILRALSQDPATAAALDELRYSRATGIVALIAGR
jgi:hypothetical protein